MAYNSNGRWGGLEVEQNYTGIINMFVPCLYYESNDDLPRSQHNSTMHNLLTNDNTTVQIQLPITNKRFGNAIGHPNFD